MGPPPLAAVAAAGFRRKPGREEFLPARIIGQDGFGLPLLELAGPFGSARLTPLAAADGLLWLPAATEEVRPGDPLRFHPFAASFGLA
jgi:molybdopterin molybdotransferase